MDYTINNNLKKPLPTEAYSVGDFNDNADSIDALLGKIANLSTTDKTNLVAAINELKEQNNDLVADLKFGGVIVAPPVTHQSIPNEVMTKVVFSRIIKQEKYVFFNIEEPTKIKIPAGISKVKIMASATWLNNSVGVRHISVDKNGSAVIGNGGISSIPAHNNAIANQASPVHVGTTVIDVLENDYFEFAVWQNSGGATTLIGTGAWFYLEVVE